MSSDTDLVTRSGIVLRPDASRTVLRPFDFNSPGDGDDHGQSRAERVAELVIDMEEADFVDEFRRVRDVLASRHREVEATMARRFAEVKDVAGCAQVEGDRSLLIGAYFLQEYAIESTALFNPSMVAHDDQTGLEPGAVRFVVSLRGIGEGHLSSVAFRVGTWSPSDGFAVEEASQLAVTPRIERSDEDGGSVRIRCDGSRSVSESVIFPVTPAQAAGIEDMRLVRFREDDGRERKLGTYTALGHDGAASELVESRDYNDFELIRMTGSAARSKGMALFPRRIGGRYAMLGRQDNERLWLLTSDTLTHWEGGEPILRPASFWEFVQIGNCGSPLEIEEGWLVLTHGVGSVREYCIGAALLDRDDPTRVLGRSRAPLLRPSGTDPGGYVPNVVYSCGAMVHDRTLLIPYGVADSFTTFAHVPVDALLSTLT